MPGYDVAALVEKSGKSAAHVYARLSLLQLVPSVAEAFQQERVTASHANLLSPLPQDVQQTAYEQCWRKDWQDREPHLLPAKHLSTWRDQPLSRSCRCAVRQGRHETEHNRRCLCHLPTP